MSLWFLTTTSKRDAELLRHARVRAVLDRADPHRVFARFPGL